MESLPIFKRSLVELLWNNIEDNLPFYEAGDFSELLGKPNLQQYQLEVDDVTFDPQLFLNLKADASGAADAFNSNLMNEAFDGITPYLASDERIWVALTHKVAPTFSYKRYLKPGMTKDEKIGVIRRHFFARGGLRGLHRNNSLACLWWYAYVCKKNDSQPLSEVLKVVLTKTDFREMLIGRPTSSRVQTVFNAVTNIVIDEYKKNAEPNIMKRENYRKWFVDINLYGGRRLYATIEETELTDLFRTLMP